MADDEKKLPPLSLAAIARMTRDEIDENRERVDDALIAAREAPITATGAQNRLGAAYAMTDDGRAVRDRRRGQGGGDQ